MDIFEKIETMFEQNISEKEVLLEILSELKSLKHIVQYTPKEYNKEYRKTLPKGYYDFVKEFRKKMQPNQREGIDPEVVVDGMRLGVNAKGLLYNKDTNTLLPRYKAFEIYEKLYQQQMRVQQTRII